MADTPVERPGDLSATSLTRRRLLINAGVFAGGVMLAGPLAACGGSSTATSGGTPKRGGNFRLGVTGGGAGDIIDGQKIVTKPDQARLVAGFETLLEYDKNYKLQTTGLAESVTQEASDKWVIRLKQGITFHNGKTLGADDVIYSLRRISDPKQGLFGTAGLASIDPNKIDKVDDRTVRLNLKQADSTIGDQLGQYYNGIVPVGYTRAGEQIGTGPYKVKSFTKGQQSVHERNTGYWRSGLPYFDTVTIIDFPDVAAQVNALRGGQIDAMTDVPAAQISVVTGQSGLAILEGQGADWRPLCMAIDMPPFDNNDVRQAFRLIVDRNAMLQQVFSGHAQIANGRIPTAPYTQCHWPPKDSNYISLYQQALAETAAGKRADIIHQMQKLEYEQGGYIIPMFNNLVDACSTKVAGFNQGSKATLNLDSFGHGYRNIWFA